MAGKPHNGYSSYRAWEVALYFDNDERAYTYIQRVLKSLTYCAERDIKKYLRECAHRVYLYYAGRYIPDTRTPISRRSIGGSSPKHPANITSTRNCPMKPITTQPIRLRKTTNTISKRTYYYCNGIHTTYSTYKRLTDYAMRNMRHSSTETFRHSHQYISGAVLISSESSWTPFPSTLIG